MNKYAIKYNKQRKRWYYELDNKFHSWVPVGTAIQTSNGTYQYNTDGTKTLLTKPKPSAQRLTNNAWRHENPTQKGKQGNLYFPFDTGVKNKKGVQLHDIGPGINMESQPISFQTRAKLGMTKQQLDNYSNSYYQKSLQKVESLLPKYTSMPDTISPQMKEGLADIDYQMGNIGQYKKLMTAIAQGDYPQIVEQSKVRFGPEQKVDTRRHQLRLQDYFYYNLGGELTK